MPSPDSPPAAEGPDADSTEGLGLTAAEPVALAVGCRATVDLRALFDALSTAASGVAPLLCGATFSRHRIGQEVELLLDRFGTTGAECVAARFSAEAVQRRVIAIEGGYRLQVPSAGGWLLTPPIPGMAAYWIPQPPMLRRLDKDGHILAHRPAAVSGLDVSADRLAVRLEQPAGHVLDLVVWRLLGDAADWLHSLDELTSLERQRHFLWSSHTAYTRPADLYVHWVHGHIYENHEVWPKYWRVCSELDAYALYVTLTGLLRATGKKLYDLLRTQLVFSVIDRQAEDGGWYHGEWTDEMESHFRLHAGGMHLLVAYLEETGDRAVATALEKAAAFAARWTDRLDAGTWYLHDSLERNADTLRRYPFRHVPSRALGKKPSNLLVLNTHLDTNIAMARYRRVSGDDSHAGLIASASAATHAVLNLRPAEWLYSPLFKLIGLTFLPKAQASALPLHLRALKRLAWKVLIPSLPRIKARFPRLVMPGGYIERELAMRTFSVRYQPVNLMDLVRTRRLFDDPALDALLTESFAFTHDSGLTGRWKELKGKEDDSLGFWAEALYHMALARPDAVYRTWLAEAILDLEDNGLGLPPSLLGANAEAVAPTQQVPCPTPVDARLRIANLSRGGSVEWLLVNPSNEAIPLRWQKALDVDIDWQPAPTLDAGSLDAGAVPARSWLRGAGKRVAPS